MKENYKKLYTNFEKSIYNISIELIKNICTDLNKTDKIDLFIEKYLLKSNTNNKKKKDIKDPKAPKRNKSSYMFFVEDIRPKLKAKFPRDSMGELSKRLGKLWSNLKDKDKRKYEKLAEKDKHRYKNDLEKYKSGDISSVEDEDEENEEEENSSISEDGSYIINGNSSNSSNSDDNTEES